MLSLQVSTYKIVTVNATRQTSDLGTSTQPNSRATTVQPRLMSHPEDSATVEHAELDNELEQQGDQGKDEMQTWMLLEASPCCVFPSECVFAHVLASARSSMLHVFLTECVYPQQVTVCMHVCIHKCIHVWKIWALIPYMSCV